ncbi:MAG: TatD DNase family protein [Patescibacteria group bacterium]|nr:TatD DNase family protein [Patescibacteria group bacterium]
MLIDTHCHIHSADYPLNINDVVKHASEQNVNKIICVGTNIEDSRRAIDFASKNDNTFASVGVHPHETKDGYMNIEELIDVNNSSLIAIGEIGLDYHYNYSPRDVQVKALESQIEMSLKYKLPIIFHVREAFDDFWPIFDNFHNIRGVLHSFTDAPINSYRGLDRGLYIGISGFSTFTKDEDQKAMFSSLPMDRILLETDAPYLTPMPLRGKVNEPAYISSIAEHQAAIRKISVEEIANNTTANACALFKF